MSCMETETASCINRSISRHHGFNPYCQINSQYFHPRLFLPDILRCNHCAGLCTDLNIGSGSISSPHNPHTTSSQCPATLIGLNPPLLSGATCSVALRHSVVFCSATIPDTSMVSSACNFSRRSLVMQSQRMLTQPDTTFVSYCCAALQFLPVC